MNSTRQWFIDMVFDSHQVIGNTIAVYRKEQEFLKFLRRDHLSFIVKELGTAEMCFKSKTIVLNLYDKNGELVMSTFKM